MQKLILRQPPTLNEMLNKARNNKYKAAKDKSVWTTRVAIAAQKQGIKPLKGLVRIITIFEYYSTASDPDNMYGASKYIHDGLVLAGILPNDTVKTLIPPYLFDIKKIPMKVKGKKNPKNTTLHIYSNMLEWAEDADKLIKSKALLG